MGQDTNNYMRLALEKQSKTNVQKRTILAQQQTLQEKQRRVQEEIMNQTGELDIDLAYTRDELAHDVRDTQFYLQQLDITLEKIKTYYRFYLTDIDQYIKEMRGLLNQEYLLGVEKTKFLARSQVNLAQQYLRKSLSQDERKTAEWDYQAKQFQLQNLKATNHSKEELSMIDNLPFEQVTPDRIFTLDVYQILIDYEKTLTDFKR